jgi:probable addiction module antidote protein
MGILRLVADGLLGRALKSQMVYATNGMTELANKTLLNRESLYETLSEKGNPQLSSIRAILGGYRLTVEVSPQ